MTQPPLVLLPDIPGYVHGIVAIEPQTTVQCDGCGTTATGTPAQAVIHSGIRFGRPKDGPRDGRRLCRDCRKEAGWIE